MEVRSSFVVLVAMWLSACAMSPAVGGAEGNPAVRHPHVPGTIFTIIFENDPLQNSIVPSNPNFWRLSQEYGSAQACISTTHPSLPNYIELTSGTTFGIANDNDPQFNISVSGSNHIADQLEAAGIPWRAYMESMGTSCNPSSSGRYSAHHNPFLYYADIVNDPARCAAHVVDMGAHFAADLASNQYRYMWITPNTCDDMHDCGDATADAWIGNTVAQIQASPGYLNGGVIFIMFDEGDVRFLSAAADVATIVVSPNLVAPGVAPLTQFDHASYLAAVEDILGLPRLPTTVDATPMDEFFVQNP